ncbi:MAG: phytanoyl-CoA dioxygenase family protein [Scytonematopsis contorta HA4267-MV1]|jgi:ectoine hydroxylase-related dioxygenase (phytanoyl-CoA dioxygenase family)|nr:phytanoyl-CoA dioxygenase family protein [Scytonematopsis contorta HA4267-MV1]
MKNISANDLSIDYSITDKTARIKSDIIAQKLLNEFGCFLAKGLLNNGEIDLIHHDIRQLISLRMQQAGLKKEIPVNIISQFDDGLQILRQLESAYVNELMSKDIANNQSSNQLEHAHSEVIANACRTLLSVQKINVHPEIVRLSKKLMSTNTVMAHMSYDLRVDYPYGDEYLFPWHQDYPVIQDSEDALVYWIPLRDVGEENGCLHIAPGSHRLGVLPQLPQREEDAVSATIPDDSILSQFPNIRVPMLSGDVLVFNTLMLHASGTNRSNNPRWSLQVRHGNFEHPKAIARNWPNSSVWNVPFQESHPEYIISNS